MGVQKVGSSVGESANGKRISWSPALKKHPRKTCQHHPQIIHHLLRFKEHTVHTAHSSRFSCSKAASVFEKSADADIIPRGQFISENEVPKWGDKMGQVELWLERQPSVVQSNKFSWDTPQLLPNYIRLWPSSMTWGLDVQSWGSVPTRQCLVLQETRSW